MKLLLALVLSIIYLPVLAWNEADSDYDKIMSCTKKYVSLCGSFSCSVPDLEDIEPDLDELTKQKCITLFNRVGPEWEREHMEKEEQAAPYIKLEEDVKTKYGWIITAPSCCHDQLHFQQPEHVSAKGEALHMASRVCLTSKKTVKERPLTITVSVRNIDKNREQQITYDCQNLDNQNFIVSESKPDFISKPEKSVNHKNPKIMIVPAIIGIPIQE